MSTKNRNTIPPTVFPNNGTLSPPPDRSTSPMIIIIGLDTELQRKRAWFGFFFVILLFRSIPSKPVTRAQMFRRIKIYIVLKGERPNTYTYIPLSNHSVSNASLTLNNNNINSISIKCDWKKKSRGFQ